MDVFSSEPARSAFRLTCIEAASHIVFLWTSFHHSPAGMKHSSRAWILRAHQYQNALKWSPDWCWKAGNANSLGAFFCPCWQLQMRYLHLHSQWLQLLGLNSIGLTCFIDWRALRGLCISNAHTNIHQVVFRFIRNLITGIYFELSALLQTLHTNISLNWRSSPSQRRHLRGLSFASALTIKNFLRCPSFFIP